MDGSVNPERHVAQMSTLVISPALVIVAAG